MTHKVPQPPALHSLLDNRDQRIGPHYCYKLQGPSAQYGLDVTFPDEGMDIDESSMSVVIPFASGLRRDGVGDLLEVGGIRTERHQKNPIVLFDHGKEVKLPIAMAMDRQTKEYTVQIDPVSQSAWCKAFFYNGKGIEGVDRTADFNHAVFCEQLFDLIAQGYIRGGSIGYQVVKALELPPDYERGIPKGLHLLSTLMLEASAVVMPANQDTVRKGLDWGQAVDFWNKNTIETAREILAMPQVCGKSLSPVLVKSLEEYTKATPRYVETPPKRYGATLEGGPYYVEKIGSGHYAAQGGRPISQKPHETREGAQNSAIRHGLRDTLQDEMKRRKQGKEMKKGIGNVVGGAISGARAGGAVGGPMGAAIGAGVGASGGKITGAVGNLLDAKAADEIKPVNQRHVSGGKGKTRTARISEPQKGSDDELKTTRKPTQLKKELVSEEKMSVAEHISPKTTRVSEGHAQIHMPEALAHTPELPSNKRERIFHRGRTGRGQATKPDFQLPTEKNLTQEKYLSARKKYRKTKSLRRKIKSGRAGAAIVYVGTKEFESAKDNASQKGIKLQHMGEFKGAVKLKLTGDDGAIDDFAREYGRPMRMGTKSLDNQIPTREEVQATFNKLRKKLSQSQALAEVEKQYGIQRTTINGQGIVTSFETLGSQSLDPHAKDIGENMASKAAPTKKKGNKPTQLAKPASEQTNETFFAPVQTRSDAPPLRIPKTGYMGKKAMDEEMIVDESVTTEPEADIDVAADQGQQEKYGAQVLRRLHQDAALLLGEYDDFINLLESDKVSKLLTGKLEHLVDMLEEIEGLFAAEYPEAAPLEGFDTFDETPNDMGPEGEEVVEEAIEETAEGDEKDVGVGIEMDDRGERAVAGDSDEEYIEDEETPELPSEMEEDVEEESWAETKNLKSLRGKYKSKPHEPSRGKVPRTQLARPKGTNPVPKTSDAPALRIPRSAGNKGFEEIADQESETCEGCGQEQCQCEPEEIQQEIADSFASHEKASIGEAAGFLSQLSNEMNYGDEHRMNSWHYHKTLDGIVGLREANEMLNEGTDIPPAEWEPGAGAKGIHVPKIKKPISPTRTAAPAPAADSQVNQATVAGGGPRANNGNTGSVWDDDVSHDIGLQGEGGMWGQQLKMCKDASSFFRELSQTRDFGDPHREKCKYWHRNLEPLSKEEDIDEEDIEEEMENGDEEVMEENEEMEVGERGEKAGMDGPERGWRYVAVSGGKPVSTHSDGNRGYEEARAAVEKLKAKDPKASIERRKMGKQLPEVSEKSIADQLAANAKAMEELNRTLLSLN